MGASLDDSYCANPILVHGLPVSLPFEKFFGGLAYG